VTIRPQRANERSGVRQVLLDAFDDDGRVADLAEALDARSDRAVPPLVAEIDGGIVGVVQLSRGWIDAPAGLVEVLVLSPLGVVPAQQRRGVGRALNDAALAEARRRDAPAVFLEGDPDYYRRLGWEGATPRGFSPPSQRIPAPAFQVITLSAWEPWMVGALVYNDTFWTHDCVGLRPPG
jgi:putative acetyltransferase